MEKEYEIVLGLEVHIELATKTKIFCGCTTAFGGEPNTHTCPVCTGMPGSLPVLNGKVLEYAVKVGMALNCEISRISKFDRKNYFYPDNPQNYQISQLYLPICHDGFLEIQTDSGKKKVGIHEIHMEEDAGKLIHDPYEEVTLVDYNRSGVPLIEIVSDPDMESAQEVIAYLEKLRTTIQYLGASDCKLQEGSMRADVNLSVREKGSNKLGVRTEMKNLNSFRAITHAIEVEQNRQIDLLESGKVVVQETRRFDDTKGESYAMRSKEDAKDYRYFPDPDLVPVCVEESKLEEWSAQMPEFQEAKKKRYEESMNLPAYDASILTETIQVASLFEQTVLLGADPKKVSNWLMGETMRLCRETNTGADELKFSAGHLYNLICLLEDKKINQTIAKEVFEVMFESDCDPVEYVRVHALETVCDETALKKAVEEVLTANEKCVNEYKNGKEKAIGALVGQTMKAMQGKADPSRIKEIIQEILCQGVSK